MQLFAGNHIDLKHDSNLEEEVANIQFKVYATRDIKAKITGAEMIRDYFYPIGESFTPLAPTPQPKQKKALKRKIPGNVPSGTTSSGASATGVNPPR